MDVAPYRVTIIVDASFGGRLANRPRQVPAWIVKSEINAAAAQQESQARPHADHLTGITIFDPISTSPVENLLGVLDNVDLHHGVYSASPPYSEIEVFGAEATEEVRSSLQQFGFVAFEQTADGFVAKKIKTE